MPTQARQPLAVDETARGRLEELAYQQGRRDADVDARLLSHDRHLRRIDGTMEKFGEVTERMDEKLDALVSAQESRDAVVADREQQTERQHTQTVSKRSLWLAAATVLVMMASLIVAVLALALSGH